jgi:hypothetical protein
MYSNCHSPRKFLGLLGTSVPGSVGNANHPDLVFGSDISDAFLFEKQKAAGVVFHNH